MAECTSKIESPYDAIVIGMGPAGANAAYHLGRSGMKVLALEKKRLPRAKLCAGGITAKAFPLLDFDFSPAVEQEVRSAYICFRHGETIDYPDLGKAGCVVDRKSFDFLLAERAIKHGVEIHDNESVTRISEDYGLIRVSTGSPAGSSAGSRDYRCRALIGADGANGAAAGYLGYKSNSCLLGVEVHVPRSYPAVGNNGDRLGFYFGDIPGGYGWIFPRRNEASVGIGIDLGRAKDARRHLESFLAGLDIPASYASGAKGHIIPVFSPFSGEHYCRGNILLAGDAASFVDPVTGEGIYYALKSGQLAACSVLSSGPGGTAADFYKKEIENDILRELRAAWRIARALYAFPKVSFKIYKAHTEIREKHFRVLLGKASYHELLSETAESIKGLFRFGTRTKGA